MVNILIKIIGIFIWAFCAITVYRSYQRIINESIRGPIGRILFYLFLILISPIFHINNLVTAIFDVFLPEGWIVGDDEFFKDDNK